MLTLDVPSFVDESRALLLIAVGLFQDREISVGQAAEIAGLTYREFLDVLHERDIAPFVYDEEMLEEDLSFVAQMRDKGKQDQ